MTRSRTTFATIEAAAIAALRASPSTTARCGGALGPDGSRRRDTRPPRCSRRERAEHRGFERWRPLR